MAFLFISFIGLLQSLLLKDPNWPISSSAMTTMNTVLSKISHITLGINFTKMNFNIIYFVTHGVANVTFGILFMLLSIVFAASKKDGFLNSILCF